MQQELTSRQRAALRAMGNPLDAIFQIGKAGIGDAAAKQVSEALEARELVKVRVLETALLTTREAADAMAQRTDSRVVQCIGTRFLLYRESHTLPVEKRIALPK